MTIKVTVTHADEDLLTKINVKLRNPKLTAEENNDLGETIDPGKSKDFYVHSSQSLIISEETSHS